MIHVFEKLDFILKIKVSVVKSVAEMALRFFYSYITIYCSVYLSTFLCIKTSIIIEVGVSILIIKFIQIAPYIT